MLARARERARAAGLANVEFANADAQTHAFDAGAWDCVYSRFGVMFFADPARAFANLRGALRRGGRVSFACWRALPENPWVTVPFAALATFLTPPPPPPPGAPGPFAFGDPDRVRGILADAGFEQIELAPHTGDLALGGSLDEAVTFAISAGPASRLLEGADRRRSRARRARGARCVRAPRAQRRGFARGRDLARHARAIPAEPRWLTPQYHGDHSTLRRSRLSQRSRSASASCIQVPGSL